MIPTMTPKGVASAKIRATIKIGLKSALKFFLRFIP
jgi:hypothetical protein